jgi:hypothetical protein
MLRIKEVRRPSRARLLAYLGCVGALFAALAACQLIAGVESRDVDPIPTACIVPSLPFGPGPSIRFANLVPNADVVDVCVRATGSSWGRPLVRDGGTDCASQLSKDGSGNPGFVYSNVTTPFTAPAPKIDVKVVAAGGTCSSATLDELDGVALAPNAVTTFIRIGGNGVARSIIALPEAEMADQSSTNLRFVHAMPGVGPLDFGLAKDQHLPTTLSGAPIVSPPIAFGTTVGPSSTAITQLEASGYVAFPSTNAYVAAAVDGGSGNAVLLQPLGNTNATFSLYAIGVANDNLHPQRSLLCQETVPPLPPPTLVNGKDVSLLAPCSLGLLPNISVDVFNPALYGPDAPVEDQRRPVNSPVVPNAINMSGADLMCVVEVDRLEDRQAILGATGTVYPNTFMITTDLSTPFTNPADQNGQVPPPPTSPPCGGSVPSADIDAVMTCVEDYCSTKPSDPTGELQSSTNCLSAVCGGQILAVKADSVSCYDCLLDAFASQEPWGSSESACETNPIASTGFEGQNSSMILSRYPLTNTDSIVIPSTNYRRAILYAQVQLEDQMVDFYCGFFISTLIGSDLPFLGPYGGPDDAGLTSAQQYSNEQDLQAQQLIAWVQKKSAGRHAIVMGDWRSSVAGTNDAGAGAPPPGDLNPMATSIIGGAPNFQAVSGPNFQTQCNYCPGSVNSYNGQDSYFVEQPFLYNWPGTGNPVTDESLLFTDPSIVTLPDGGVGPLSPYYGLNITLIRPPVQ